MSDHYELVQNLISPSTSSIEEEADNDIEESDAASMSASDYYIDPEPYLSNQFYTFNRDSHHLMVHSIQQYQYPTPEEIKSVTPPSVLASWRTVWKDRNEDTAYTTGWKRIQDKLKANIDQFGNELLYFKNNPNQYVPHINQWQDIAMGYHSVSELKHLGLKETIDKIKQVWTVGAKFYGIPEAFIRACLSNCRICCSDGPSSQARSKRRRFEYTDTFEIPAKEVPQKLQQLALKHKVVLCIRQKYIRYKPFMAEVKDYCCHRAGEPNMKKPGLLKRKRYSSKRCGCGFRIRAIVPIKDYNQKDRTFSYEDDGKAVFKLYAVHSGHEPGPHEGSARIIHRFVAPANIAIEQGIVCIGEEGEEGETFTVIENDEGSDIRLTVMRQIEEFKQELGCIEAKIPEFSEEMLGTLSHELCAVSQRLRSFGEVNDREELLLGKQHSEEGFVNEPNSLNEWAENPECKNNSRAGSFIDGENCFPNSCLSPRKRDQGKLNEGALSDVGCSGNSKMGKWDLPVKEPCAGFDDKALLPCGGAKICKEANLDMRHDMPIVVDEHLVGMPVDGYYHDSIKWYLDSSPDCGDNMTIGVQEGFKHAIL
ncbi:hypothetical protein AMTRI_Chr06g191750 [Amborella trichopoda]|uniref:Uncharacterized protein n=1 Tax=Amborella trichopoda TaxID=13333 RepID=W1PEB4_AMBTC|nr:uncharacterized protein LOC18434485 [Amborella trichopoda]ERN06293.1 hypothetical protein AMTR_s00016p00224460 [Amborella trichopoda]|eukprot:XP_006844618.1 uncharacterized protein LOC18434485 [Amborella trichopoda]